MSARAASPGSSAIEATRRGTAKIIRPADRQKAAPTLRTLVTAPDSDGIDAAGTLGRACRPGIATTTREVWLNVHSDLQFAPRIRAVRSFLKNTLKQDPDMQVTLAESATVAESMPEPRTADCKNA